MTDTMSSQNIDLSSWDTLYNTLYKFVNTQRDDFCQMYFQKPQF